MANPARRVRCGRLPRQQGRGRRGAGRGAGRGGAVRRGARRTVYMAGVWAAGVGAIFLDMEGFEKAPPLTLRRILLELAAIRYAVNGVHSTPLGDMLANAGLSPRGREASLVLRAASRNNVVYVDHQEMYNTMYLGPYLDLDVFIECNPIFVAKWVAEAGGGDNVYAFDGVPQDMRDTMTEELDGMIDRLKKHLAGSEFSRERGCYVRHGSRAES